MAQLASNTLGATITRMPPLRPNATTIMRRVSSRRAVASWHPCAMMKPDTYSNMAALAGAGISTNMAIAFGQKASTTITAMPNQTIRRASVPVASDSPTAAVEGPGAAPPINPAKTMPREFASRPRSSGRLSGFVQDESADRCSITRSPAAVACVATNASRKANIGVKEIWVKSGNHGRGRSIHGCAATI